MDRFPFSPHIDHPSHARPGIWPFPDRLYVITVMFNPHRWRSRYLNYRTFQKRVDDAAAVLYTAEAAFGGRLYEITEQTNPRHVQFRTPYELWLKENMINVTMQRLPPDWKYVAWVDADVLFARPDWAQETLHQLQHYKVVQMFSHAQDLGPDCQPVREVAPGFMYAYNNHAPGEMADLIRMFARGGTHTYPYPPGKPRAAGVPYVHPGFAWAARREAIDLLGGLIDWAILGAGDWHMATALIGQIEKSMSKEYSEGHKKLLYQWQDRAEKHIRRNVGHVPGLLNHHWHGNKADRRYAYRWRLLADTKFDPRHDLKRDWQGLWQLVDHGDMRSIRLRDGLMEYARARNEDDISL